MKSRLHGGWKGTVFNTFFVGTFNALPRRVGTALRLAPAGVLPQMKSASRPTRSETISCCCDAADVPPCRIDRRSRDALCERHRGIGADGLICLQRHAPTVPSMQLLNADGSRSEVSGNGVRCLAAWLARTRPCSGRVVDRPFETDAGSRCFELPDVERIALYLSRRDGPPRGRRANARLDVDGAPGGGGQPSRRQPAVRGPRRGQPEPGCIRVAAGWRSIPLFPKARTSNWRRWTIPDRVRILIWERGVGPTEASGTGACAAAVAAIAFAGAARDVQVASPGGTQRVEWTDDGLFLTGWAEVIAEGRWRL